MVFVEGVVVVTQPRLVDPETLVDGVLMFAGQRLVPDTVDALGLIDVEPVAVTEFPELVYRPRPILPGRDEGTLPLKVPAVVPGLEPP